MKPTLVPPVLDRPALTAFLVDLDATFTSEAPVIILAAPSGARGLALEAVSALDPSELGAAFLGFEAVLAKLSVAPKPIVAVVSGAALGGGLGLVALADHLIARDDARFGLPEALLGLAPAMVRPALLRRLTPHAFRALALRAESVSADSALQLGLVDEVVAEGELDRAVSATVRRYRRVSPRSVAALRALEGPLRGVESGRAVLLDLLASADTKLRIERFTRGEAPWVA